MRYTVLTLFPEITDAFFATSIMAKAIARGIVEYRAINIRDFAFDKHRTCDDAPYGGGAGMLMTPEPLGRALEAAGARPRFPAPDSLLPPEPSEDDRATQRGVAQDARPRAAVDRGETSPPKVIYLSPSGRPLTQGLARELSGERELVLLCGRYEGIDQRVIDRYIDEEISVGDYVLSSGEVAALALIDATYRLIDEVIAPESLAEESFSGGLLEYPQYTRPEIYANMRVPDVLISGHHENVRRWRLQRRAEKTLRVRPELIARGLELGLFDDETKRVIDRLLRERGAGVEGEKNE
ncbi:MAG: tRNA (guanosine(37)-N1)-methyltransferase TrmD [Treponema sp.]|nr:tRNA (guanosine(37)-N1)-methyltransferase TrmD [Treponema sp.]